MGAGRVGVSSCFLGSRAVGLPRTRAGLQAGGWRPPPAVCRAGLPRSGHALSHVALSPGAPSSSRVGRLPGIRQRRGRICLQTCVCGQTRGGGSGGLFSCPGLRAVPLWRGPDVPSCPLLPLPTSSPWLAASPSAPRQQAVPWTVRWPAAAVPSPQLWGSGGMAGVGGTAPLKGQAVESASGQQVRTEGEPHASPSFWLPVVAKAVGPERPVSCCSGGTPSATTCRCRGKDG